MTELLDFYKLYIEFGAAVLAFATLLAVWIHNRDDLLWRERITALEIWRDTSEGHWENQRIANSKAKEADERLIIAINAANVRLVELASDVKRLNDTTIRLEERVQYVARRPDAKSIG